MPYLTLNFCLGLSSDECASVETTLAKLAADDAVAPLDCYVCDDACWILEVAELYDYGHERLTDIAQQTACQVATAVVGAIPRARFTIKVTIEHVCPGCDHCCEREDVVWTTDSPGLPEETELMSAVVNGEVCS